MGDDVIELIYTGTYVNGKMDTSEPATYTFPNGTVYEGTFKNGCFHGEGVLSFPDKGNYRGVWRDGQLITGNYTFEDGLKHEDSDEWPYCTEKDRRYWVECQHRIRPAGNSFIRSELRHGKSIPRGTYDVMDGYYNEQTGNVYCYESGTISGRPDSEQAAVIEERAYKQMRQHESKSVE